MQLFLNGTEGGVWLIEAQRAISAASCAGIACGVEGLQVLLTFCVLLSLCLSVSCALNFFREDKEEQITPLCPSLIVNETLGKFRMVLDAERTETEVTDLAGKPLCRVSFDRSADPFRPEASAMATARVVATGNDDIYATIVARNAVMKNQALALCRGPNEIWGFLEVARELNLYHVRHRTGVLIMTFHGDFNDIDVGVFNSAKVQVGHLKAGPDGVKLHVMQYIDAGLVVSGFLAACLDKWRGEAASPLPEQPEEEPASARGRALAGAMPALSAATESVAKDSPAAAEASPQGPSELLTDATSEGEAGAEESPAAAEPPTFHGGESPAAAEPPPLRGEDRPPDA